MPAYLNIIIAQLDFCVDDIAGNTRKIIAATQRARDELKGDVVVFPELTLCGYPPEDLLLRADFHQQIDQAMQRIIQQAHGIDIVLGHPHRVDNHTYNAASVLREGQVITRYYKQCLPNYGVFDEQRYFSAGTQPGLFTLKNTTIGINICEDVWHPAPIAQVTQAGAQLLLCLNASPFDYQKAEERELVLRQRISENKIPVIYAHGVSGQDDLIFDGGSMAMNSNGVVCAHAGFFEEKLWPVKIEINNPIKIVPQKVAPKPSPEALVYQALVLSVKDYIKKNNFPGVLVGLSGGIDSSLTLTIAVDALGKERAEAVIMPSRYTSELSMDLIQKQVAKLGVKTHVISIEPTFTAALNSLAADFSGLKADQTEENMQARCRALIIMALSNKTGKMVLTTGNKSEMATGYATLYGDMAGGYAVLKDLPKTWVYKLARYRNSIQPVIPEEIITRAPTAELAPDQTDQDTLPPYSELDAILEFYVEQDKSLVEIVAQGFKEETVKRVIAMVNRNEYKRRQSAPGPRITTRAFTRERRYPITRCTTKIDLPK